MVRLFLTMRQKTAEARGQRDAKLYVVNLSSAALQRSRIRLLLGAEGVDPLTLQSSDHVAFAQHVMKLDQCLPSLNTICSEQPRTCVSGHVTQA